MTAQDPDAIARAELRARQGLGARYDAPAAPAEMLLLARRGTAYFARKLNELDDHALDLPGYAGEPRRRIISRVGYQARALSRLIETARTGVTQPKHTSAEQIETELSDGATLPAHALRYLFAHSEVHLSVEWRDLSNAGWDVALTDWRGAPIGPRDTVLLRAHGLGRGRRLGQWRTLGRCAAGFANRAACRCKVTRSLCG